MALQVGPNPSSAPQSDGHAELRNRPEREGDADASLSPESAWLAECLEQLSDDASRAHTMAQIKRNTSAGDERVLANHCLGMAATELGRWSEAALAFADAREEIPVSDPRARSRFSTMAGNAELADGDPAGALLHFQAAKADARRASSAPLEAIASTDLARVLVGMGQTSEALTALQDATRLLPDSSEPWLLTATLLRRLERLDEAQTAIERAALLAPSDAQIGLEAGVIAVLSGRENAARESWQSVVNIQPDSLAAQTAREYLAQLGPVAESQPSDALPTQEPS